MAFGMLRFAESICAELETLTTSCAPVSRSTVSTRSARVADPAKSATLRPTDCTPLSLVYRSSTCRIAPAFRSRSEEHTSELQSHLNLVSRLLLDKKQSTPHLPQP